MAVGIIKKSVLSQILSWRQRLERLEHSVTFESSDLLLYTENFIKATENINWGIQDLESWAKGE